jgi:1,4-dihydroxy-2-naphthoyl-CoA hydrolase
MPFIIKPSLEQLNSLNRGTIAEFLEIEMVEVGEDHLVARMPVNDKTHQPLGMLHGGASCVLAEQVGSVTANLYLDRNVQVAVGLDINANHIKSVRSGYVYGRAEAIYLGGRTQVMQIRITNDAGELVCIARLTMMIVNVTADYQRKHPNTVTE